MIKKRENIDETMMKKFIESCVEKEKYRTEKIKDMMTNPDYFEWLNEFTQDKKGFSDDTWLYFPNEIKDSDKENVEELHLFYDGIDKYASANYIYPVDCEYGNFYKIRLDEIGFEIGVLSGQGVVFFCKKVPVENEQEFIDFNDIMTGKKQEEVDRIDASLDFLSEMVLATYESGVPIEAIANKLDSVVKELAVKDEDKAKTLIKK